MWGNVEFYNVTQTGFGVRIVAPGTDKGLLQVKVPIWNENVDVTGNNQDDIEWYVATKQGDDYLLSVDISNHGNLSGKYHVHVYLTSLDNIQEKLSENSIIVPELSSNAVKRGGFDIYHWNSFEDRQLDRLERVDSRRKVIHTPYARKGNKISAGEVLQAINSIHEFTFSIPMQNTLYQKLIPFKSIVKVVNLNDGETEFEGRVLSATNKMTASGFVQEVICEDFLSFFHDSSQHFQKLQNIGARAYLEEILKQHNNQVEPYKRIYLGNVTVVSQTDKPWRYLGYESTWETIRERIINSIGGYLSIREEYNGFYLDWTAEIGVNKQSPIQLGKNIKSASREVSFDGLATQVMPIGADEDTTGKTSEEQGSDVTRKQVDISSVNNGNLWLEDVELIKQFGIIRKPVIWTEIDNPSVLKSRGLQYLQNQKIALAKWTISAVERYLIDGRYDKFKIGNKHPILNAPLSGVETLQIIEKKIDVLNPQTAELTIGSQSQSLISYQLQMQEATKSIEKVKIDQLILDKQNQIALLNQEIERLKTLEATPVPEGQTPPDYSSQIASMQAQVVALNQELLELIGGV